MLRSAVVLVSVICGGVLVGDLHNEKNEKSKTNVCLFSSERESVWRFTTTLCQSRHTHMTQRENGEEKVRDKRNRKVTRYRPPKLFEYVRGYFGTTRLLSSLVLCVSHPPCCRPNQCQSNRHRCQQHKGYHWFQEDASRAITVTVRVVIARSLHTV